MLVIGEVAFSAEPMAEPLPGAACRAGMLNRPKTKAISVAINVLFMWFAPLLALILGRTFPLEFATGPFKSERADHRVPGDYRSSVGLPSASFGSQRPHPLPALNRGRADLVPPQSFSSRSKAMDS